MPLPLEAGILLTAYRTDPLTQARQDASIHCPETPPGLRTPEQQEEDVWSVFGICRVSWLLCTAFNPAANNILVGSRRVRQENLCLVASVSVGNNDEVPRRKTCMLGNSSRLIIQTLLRT